MVFLADLPVIFDRFGNRGYRPVQLEAGIPSAASSANPSIGSPG
jgi:hypothetical protein